MSDVKSDAEENPNPNWRGQVGWLLLLKWLISLALLVWVWQSVKDQMSTLNRESVALKWLLPAVLTGLLMVALMGLRWWCILRTQGLNLSYWLVTLCSAAGLIFDAALLGAAGGDVARALLLRRLAGVPLSVAAATLMADHLAGLGSLLLIGGTCSYLGRDLFAESSLGKMAFGYLALFLVLGVILLGVSFVLRGQRGLGWLPSSFAGREALLKLVASWQAVGAGWPWFVAAAMVSAPLIVAHFSVFWMLMEALNAGVRWWDVMVVMPVVDALGALPITVSGLGLREALFVELLGVGESDGALAWAGVGGHLLLAGFGLAGWWTAVMLGRHGSR
jgi:uncharacterized membrane protein YbhN (UPF0104 family)